MRRALSQGSGTYRHRERFEGSEKGSWLKEGREEAVMILAWVTGWRMVRPIENPAWKDGMCGGHGG